MTQTQISIRNARSHNLRGVDCDIPLRSLTVVTGVSGSGKSTLAFDTLYAEGQRRYVTSLSTYARQFLERLPRPAVDAISHLPPAIAIEQRNRVTNVRSTVGTATEILDYLRLAFGKIGETRCPDCDLAVQPGDPGAVCARIAERWAGERISLGAPLQRRQGEAARELRDRLARDGYTRLFDEAGQVVDCTEIPLRQLTSLRKSGLLLMDRLRVPSQSGGARLGEAISAGFARGGGEVVVLEEDNRRTHFLEAFACDGCGRVFRTPEPALFSFNSPLGACATCQGFGRVPGLDFDKVVPDPRKSIEEGAIAPFTTAMGRRLQRDLVRSCQRVKLPVEKPFAELTPKQQSWVFGGDDEDWYGVRGFFEWLEGRRYKVQARVMIARYRRFDPCPDCKGARLCPEALSVHLGGTDIAELCHLSIAELRQWLEGLSLSSGQQERGGRVVELLLARLATVEDVGLGYMPLDRPMRTLSGGEAQRIQLGTALGGSLTATLYILDEPSVGLHSRDVARLLRVLESIRSQGNTVVVVEHAPEIIQAAHHIIDLGPAAGHAGGEVVVAGTIDMVRANPHSATGRALRGECELHREGVRASTGTIRVRGARENNLNGLDADFPLGNLTVVTGVSGAGKSTLVRKVLIGHLRGDPDRGECDSVEGAKLVSDVVVVDQTPASRTPRSNIATVSKAFDGIRKRFAATREAKARGLGPGSFSFNVRGGRCESCEGAGEVVIDMQFLDDVRVACDDCAGRRYRREILAVHWQGKSVADVLEMTLDEAIALFVREKQIVTRLEPFARVGLGYLTLGQPLSTLSGGENQRVRLALALGEDKAGALYVMDEPTTGLHPADIEVLLGCLDALVDAGGTVVLVEHNLDVIRHADFVIDLGPEGGPGGGRIVATGSPAEIATVASSHTGLALRKNF